MPACGSSLWGHGRLHCPVRLVADSGWNNALYTYWDASIVGASVVAMVLLSKKKVESWWLWIAPVNISAIGLYTLTCAYMFAALYMLFLLMAFVGLPDGTGRWAAHERHENENSRLAVRLVAVADERALVVGDCGGRWVGVKQASTG